MPTTLIQVKLKPYARCSVLDPAGTLEGDARIAVGRRQGQSGTDRAGGKT
jgi:hypothetical protein